MNAAALASSAYASPQQSVVTARQAEYRAFARITSRLSAAAKDDDPRNFADLAAALHENLRLWTTLALDVAQDANGLPDQLRARLFYLADFTRAHSMKVLARAADPAALIDVNTAVMKGLRGAAGPEDA